MRCGNRFLLVVALGVTGIACQTGSPEKRPTAAPPPTTASGDGAAAPPEQARDTKRIDSELSARRMKIWGEVRVILKSKHAPLPPLEKRSTASKADPSATVINATPYGLTIWLAGPCLQKLELPPQSEKSVVFCAGAYVVAARVSAATFLPLVRENQTFEVGVRYTLRIQVQRTPTVTRTKRWVQ
jgi:hypothetical protein